MSCVTSVLLLTDCDDGGIHRVQAWLETNNLPILKEIGCVAGGNKFMQCDVWAGAYNYFNVKRFIDAVNTAGWDYNQSVQLLVKGEHDEFFTQLLHKEK
jgi:hypothetical protein